jgi:hypothetical protein
MEQYWDVIIMAMTVIVNAAVFLAYIKFEVRQVRKDMEKGDKNIEEKRMINVGYLKEIYNAKIEDSKKYAKGLFDMNSADHTYIKSEMSDMKADIENLSKKQEDNNTKTSEILRILKDKL